MKKTLFAVLAVIAMATAQAGSADEAETSAIVKGTIVLARDGSVQSAVVNDVDKYGQPIADMVHNAALKWRFQPVLRDGEPVLAKSNMHVRVVLKRSPDGNYSARIKGATFSSDAPDDTEALRDDKKKVLPKYPRAAARGRVEGTVYLALRVDRSGHVTEVVAEQVNLGSYGSSHLTNQYRELLAKASVVAARSWTYVVPTTGKLANQDTWTARVPVNFYLTPMGADKSPPVWQTYFPGPFTPAPWVDKPDTDSADALADDTVQTDGAGPTLLSPIGHG